MNTGNKGIVHLVVTAILSLAMAHHVAGCKPPNSEAMEAAYNAELLKCVQDSKTANESCECRKAVDEKWGVCDHPAWPRIGRCDYKCGD